MKFNVLSKDFIIFSNEWNVGLDQTGNAEFGSYVIVRSWGEYENKQNKRFNSCRNKTWILAAWLYKNKNDIVEEKQRIPARSVSSNHHHFSSRVFVFFFFVFCSISAKNGFRWSPIAWRSCFTQQLLGWQILHRRVGDRLRNRQLFYWLISLHT